MAKSGYCQVTGAYCASLDEHHVVPREFGGENGPTVLLSPSAHHTIHRSVNNPKVKDEFLSSLSTKGRALALSLIETIRKSEVVHKEKTQKEFITVSVKLRTQTHSKLYYIAKEQGLSVTKLISKLLESA